MDIYCGQHAYKKFKFRLEEFFGEDIFNLLHSLIQMPYKQAHIYLFFFEVSLNFQPLVGCFSGSLFSFGSALATTISVFCFGNQATPNV